MSSDNYEKTFRLSSVNDIVKAYEETVKQKLPEEVQGKVHNFLHTHNFIIKRATYHAKNYTIRDLVINALPMKYYTEKEFKAIQEQAKIIVPVSDSELYFSYYADDSEYSQENSRSDNSTATKK